MRVRKLTTMLAALLACTAATTAQAAPKAKPPIGIVDDPCVGAPVLPASVRDFFIALLNPAEAKPGAPPLGEYAEYKDAAEKAKKTDWAALCYYRADNQRLAALPRDDQRIVYMGDSITEIWGLAMPAFFNDSRVNRGVSGQTTDQMLVRFQADVIALKPRMVHILAGTNDIGSNNGPRAMQDVRNNLMAMASLARANGIAVIFASVPPAASFSWQPRIKPAQQIRDLNAWLKDYAQQSGASFVDYYSLLTDANGGMQAALTFDGVHLNTEGYRKIDALSRAATR